MAKAEETANLIAKFKQLQAEKARLEAENEILTAKLAKGPKMRVKIGKKGGISVYGLGRFPITLYREQWPRLWSMQGDIDTFIEANTVDLKFKDTDDDAARVAGGGIVYVDEEK
jgi:hypothetical protein